MITDEQKLIHTVSIQELNKIISDFVKSEGFKALKEERKKKLCKQS